MNYISVIIGDVGLTVLTKDLCMEIKPLTLWLLCHNLQFRQLLGSLFVRLDLGRPSNVTDEGVPGVFVVQSLMIVLGGGGVMAGTVEAGETNVDALLQILETHQFQHGRRGNGGAGLLGNQSTECILLCGQSDQGAGEARQRHEDTPLSLRSSWMVRARDQETAPVSREHKPGSQKLAEQMQKLGKTREMK